MEFRDDRRAQSTLIGFVLLFGILVVAFSSYQAVVVPNQNAQVEYTHSQAVLTDIQELRNSLLDVRSVEQSGDDEYVIVSEHPPTSVRLGTQYPARLIAMNPPPASGTLRTIEPATDVRIENANVTGTAASNLDGNLSALFAAHETTFLTYEPNYNEYGTAPTTVLEHSLLYNDFSDANLTVREQSVVNTTRDRITIVLFDGSVSRSGSGAVTLDPQTLDGPTAPVPIEPETGNTITLRLPTRAPGLWEQAVADLPDAEINEAESSETEVVIELQGSYDLRMAEVGVDGGTGADRFTPIQYNGSDAPRLENGSLPGPRVYDADGAAGGTVQQGGSFDLSANVSNIGTPGSERAGTPIQAAEWYLEGDDPGKGNGVSMAAIEGEYLRDVEVRVQDTVDAADLSEGNNTLIIRGQDSRGIWGEETDNVTVEVENESETPPSAETIELVADSGGTFWGAGGAEFQFQNTGSEQASITGITIESTSRGQVAEVSETNGGEYGQGQHEVYIDASTDGVLDMDGTPYWEDAGTPLEIGSAEPLTESAGMDPGSVSTVYLYAFRNNGGQTVGMSGATVTVTLEFGDGSSETYSVEIQ